MTSEDAIFLHNDIQDLFSGLTVVVMGDSIQRSVYKDLVCLFDDPSSGYVFDHELRAKGEQSFRNDKLLYSTDKTNGTSYREVREYRYKNTVFRFYFITRCWNEYMESVLRDHFSNNVRPDVIIMNSALWDMHHYGEEGKFVYEQNMRKLFIEIQRLPSRPLLLWNSALPLAEVCKGGFLRKGFKTLPWHDIERANLIAQSMAYNFDCIYVDLRKSLFRSRIFTQADDGIHWSNKAHRNITNSILTAICRRWDMHVPIPVTLLPPENPYYHNRPYMPPPQIPPPQVLPPQPLMTPPSNRYHPYARQWLNNGPLMPRAHQRSYTDPFPLPGRQVKERQFINERYRSRFNKMSRMKTDSSTKMDRRPLTESNTSNSTPTATATSNKETNNPLKDDGKGNINGGKDQSSSLQNTIHDLENYKNCELCCSDSDCENKAKVNQTPADDTISSTEAVTDASNLGERLKAKVSCTVVSSIDPVSSSNSMSEIASVDINPTVELAAKLDGKSILGESYEKPCDDMDNKLGNSANTVDINNNYKYNDDNDNIDKKRKRDDDNDEDDEVRSLKTKQKKV